MIRLGFGTRLFVIFLTSLVVLQLLAVVAFLLQRSRATDSGLRFPLPDQAAALVELIESMPKEQWPRLLRAANSSELSVRIVETPPDARETAWNEAPVVEFIMRRYLAALGGRDVKVRIEPSTELLEGPMRLLAWASPGSIEIDIALKGGERLLVSASGYQSLSVLGLPPGFWAGLLGAVVAALALYLLRREARPLRDLADDVDRVVVGTEARLIPDAPRSAPEIRALIAAFNRLTQRIASLLRARMALVGGISHDLRTYVTRLRLRADLIGDARERDRAIADLEDMSRLIDDSLLAFEAGAPLRHEELVDIAQLLAHEADERRRAGAAVGLAISEKALGAQVIGDPVALRRLVQNLVDNAIKYGERADIAADASARELIVTVDDRGPGIGADDRQTLMEPFVRLERSRNRKTGGAGLGLAIARGVAEAHGGSVTLGDAPGRGLRATISLPVYVGSPPGH